MSISELYFSIDHIEIDQAVFSNFFLSLKKLPIVVARDVCLSVCPSVRRAVCLSVHPSVEKVSFCGISISNKPIDLKMSMNVCKGVVHVRKT